MLKRRISIGVAAVLGAVLLSSCIVGPADPAGHVTVYASPGVVQVGGELHVFAGAFNRTGSSTRFDGPVRWTVSDTSLARLIPNRRDSEVEVRGVRAGIVTVTATAGGASGSAQVQVIPRLSEVSLHPAPVSVKAGDTTRVVAIARDEAGREVTGLTFTWEMANYSIAAFNGPGGLVLGRAPGTTTVRASVAGTGAIATVTVHPGP